MGRRNSNFTSLKKVKVAKEKFKCVAVLLWAHRVFNDTAKELLLYYLEKAVVILLA